MKFVAATIRRIRRDGRASGNHADATDANYGSHWVPTDETEAMYQILNVSDPEAFEAAGRDEAERMLAPFVQPTDTVLDLGCGIGRVARYVAPLCRELWAVDVSEAMLGYARRRLGDLPNVRFARGDGASLPEQIPAASIDFAYSLLTLQHVEREHAFMLLRDLRRVLRPGGVAHLTFPNLLADTYLAHFVQYAETGETTNAARARFYTPQEVERILPAAGFAIRELAPDVEIRVTCDTA
jgi:ubiquinone/menaquinone biosynthesis C-methylase UbiE